MESKTQPSTGFTNHKMLLLQHLLHKLEYRCAKRIPASDKYRLAFLPEKRIKWFINPKVGSTFLSAALAKHPTFIIPGQHRVPDWNPTRSDWYSFVFVRHPVQRFLSCWQSKIFSDRHHIFNLSEHEAKAMQDLDAFIAMVNDKDLVKCDPHLSLQTANFPLGEVSFTGKLESFSADVQRLNAETGININASLPAPNKTNKPVITPRQTARIEELYAADMNLLGY